MNMISVKQLREDFKSVKNGIAQGKSYILLYRSQPLAEIRPYSNQDKVEMSIEEKLKLVKKLSGGFRSGKNLTAKKINQIIDKSYEHLLY